MRCHRKPEQNRIHLCRRAYLSGDVVGTLRSAVAECVGIRVVITDRDLEGPKREASVVHGLQDSERQLLTRHSSQRALS